MNVRQKKKAQAYKGLTYKQRIKNQAKTIRQLNAKVMELERLVNKQNYTVDLAKEVVILQDKRIEIMQEIIDEKQAKLEKLKNPWWKKVSKRGN